jgi:hypothetical protein
MPQLRRGARANPRDDLVVIRVAGGDVFNHRGIEVGVLLCPCPPVGVQESRGQEKRCSLVADSADPMRGRLRIASGVAASKNPAPSM